MILSHMAKYDPDLSAVFRALADPNRRAMMARLGKGAIAVSELAGPTGLTLPTVLRHLEILEEARLIETEKTGRTRFCRSCPETLAATSDWLAAQRTAWEARTDRLEAYVATLMKDQTQ